MERDTALSAVRRDVDRHRRRIEQVARSIWERPELCFEERFAHDLLADELAAAGFAVERQACGLDTAFIARAGRSDAAGPTVAIVCEYDALPGLGHACGHNVIAAAGLGAALAIRGVIDELDGRVVVLGAPAEEGGGGKGFMIEQGALDGVDVAMMVHPADADLDAFWSIAVHELTVTYSGKPAHAAAAPHEGRNALDAAVLGYQAVGALRQHIEGHERVHGIFTRGGDKPNIVPHRTEMVWFVRSGTSVSLDRLKPRVLAALESGALATGCTMTHSWGAIAYDELIMSSTLDRVYAAHALDIGRVVKSRDQRPEFLGSTDMGNISHLVPSLHPMIATAPTGTQIHTPEFAVAAGGPLGAAAAVDGALLLALTAVDIWLDPQIARDAAAELAARPSTVRPS